MLSDYANGQLDQAKHTYRFRNGMMVVITYFDRRDSRYLVDVNPHARWQEKLSFECDSEAEVAGILDRAAAV